LDLWFLFVGLMGLWVLGHVAHALWTGVARGRWGARYDRRKDPFSFWLYVATGVLLLMLLSAIVLTAAGVLEIDGEGPPS
jgi:hypothetical protein